MTKPDPCLTYSAGPALAQSKKLLFRPLAIDTLIWISDAEEFHFAYMSLWLREARRRRREVRRLADALSWLTAVSRAQAGSWGGPRCPQPDGHSLAGSINSANAATTSSSVTWARPNERMPGVSI